MKHDANVGLLRRTLPVVLLMIAMPPATSGAEAVQLRLFDFEPRISASETYSDGGTGFGRSSDGLTTSVDPGFTLRRDGARVKTDINYSLNNLYYHNDSEMDLRHQFNGSVLGELVQNELFIDSSFRKRDQIISPLGTSNIDSSLQRDNLTSSTSWSIGPRWERRFADVATSTLEYQVDRVSFSGGAADDSWGSTLTGVLNSGPMFGDWFWSADYSNSDIRYSEGGENSEFEMYSGTLGYNLTRKLNVYYTVGNEKNSFRNSVGDTGGSYWNVGVGFTPSVRTSLNMTYGKRFFGDTYSFSISHQARKWNVVVSRAETITTTRQLQLGDIFLICPPEIPDCTPEEAIAFGVDIGVRDGTYIESSLTGSLAYTLPKSALTLSVFDRERTFQDGADANDETSGTTLGWNWRLGPRTNFNASTGWTRYRFLSTPVAEVDRWFVRTGVTRELSPELSGSLNYSYQKRSSDGVGSGLRGTGNTVSARLTKTF